MIFISLYFFPGHKRLRSFRIWSISPSWIRLLKQHRTLGPTPRWKIEIAHDLTEIRFLRKSASLWRFTRNKKMYRCIDPGLWNWVEKDMKKEERLKIMTPVQEIEKFLPHGKSIFGAREIYISHKCSYTESPSLDISNIQFIETKSCISKRSSNLRIETWACSCSKFRVPTPLSQTWCCI